ncbi:hypothetical protein U1Q18_033707 [Sarracenia purpurea var. burkii]
MPFSPFSVLLLSAALLLISTAAAAAISIHNRRTLHQPFFPQNSLPPTQPPSLQPPTPKYPFSSSNPNQQPFFPSIPSQPPPPSPPAPPTLASFPANIPSLNLPHAPKSKPVSYKLVSVAVVLVVSAVVVSAITILLYVRRRRRSFSESKTYRSENSNGVFHANMIPKPRRSPPTSSEFLYLGTIVNSHGGVDARDAPNSGGGGAGGDVSLRKLDSPELRPLPTLRQQNFRRNSANADGGSAGLEEDEEFYSPRGSSGGPQSSIGTGSDSRRAFASVAAKMFDTRSESSSSQYSSSNSGSPTRSVSLSISPPVSLSPRNLMPKSPELVAAQAAPPPSPPPPTPPLPQRRLMTQLANLTSSPSPSPPSSSSPERASEKSLDSSPRISDSFAQNVFSRSTPERPSEKSQGSTPRLSNVLNQNTESPARIKNSGLNKMPNQRNSRSPSPSSSSSPKKPLEKNQDSSPRMPNVPLPNVASSARISNNIQTPDLVSVSPAPPPPPPPPPPPGHWESPVRTSSFRQPIMKPPVLVAPSRPLSLHSPTLISPIELPPGSENVEKNDETPKPKLKPLHWDKVRASSDREMVWDQLKSSSFKLNEEMIETLFVVNAPNSSKESTRRPVLPSPNQENRVLDPKKAQNIAISLRALNVTIEEVCEALSEGNADALGTELLESLLRMAPTKEEERRLKEYRNDSPFKLGPAERFLKAVLDIPFAFKRVDTMLYVANFGSEVEYLKSSFDTLEAQPLVSAVKFK